jgi:predicted phosphodiesterase
MSGFHAEVISDTHLNISKPSDQELLKIFSLQAPNLILAGDIGDPDEPTLYKFLDMARQRYKRVIYVPGNHEFYGREPGSKKNPSLVLRWFQALDDKWPNFHFFYRRNEVIDGVRVLGTTGWSTEPSGTEWAKTIGEEGRKDIKFLEEGIANSKEPVLVITHYPSTLQVVQDNFKGKLSQFNYGQDLERLYRPPVHTWIFGHIHQKHDFLMPYSSSMYGNGFVRILCVPHGYHNEREQGAEKTLAFKVPSKLVEVKSLYDKTYQIP